jgi:hypothetical protein
MDLEKEKLRLALMGYEVKTTHLVCGAAWFSEVVSINNADFLILTTGPMSSEEDSIEHAIKLFKRFGKFMEKRHAE